MFLMPRWLTVVFLFLVENFTRMCLGICHICHSRLTVSDSKDLLLVCTGTLRAIAGSVLDHSKKANIAIKPVKMKFLVFQSL